jgi:hypothetical protein
LVAGQYNIGLRDLQTREIPEIGKSFDISSDSGLRRNDGFFLRISPRPWLYWELQPYGAEKTTPGSTARVWRRSWL